MRRFGMRAALLAGLSSLAYACGGGSPDTVHGPPGTSGPGGPSIAWGPRLASSGLSSLAGAEDAFGAELGDALARAARALPNGASQSSLVENGRTADAMSAEVVRGEDGNLVHEVTDGARIFTHVPLPIPRQGLDLALFTDLIPGIEPDLSSYPHELLGVWAWNGEVGAFWSRSPSIPPVTFGPASPTGTATYEGDAAGLHSAGGAATTFLADVEMVADFDSHTVSGAVDGFRSVAGKALAGLSVTLGEAGFPADGAPFSGETTSGVPGGGKWGGRWSDGEGRTMAGTFGFAADDGSIALLGAFSACSCSSTSGGNPDDPVATDR